MAFDPEEILEDFAEAAQLKRRAEFLPGGFRFFKRSINEVVPRVVVPTPVKQKPPEKVQFRGLQVKINLISKQEMKPVEKPVQRVHINLFRGLARNEKPRPARWHTETVRENLERDLKAAFWEREYLIEDLRAAYRLRHVTNPELKVREAENIWPLIQQALMVAPQSASELSARLRISNIAAKWALEQLRSRGLATRIKTLSGRRLWVSVPHNEIAISTRTSFENAPVLPPGYRWGVL